MATEDCGSRITNSSPETRPEKSTCRMPCFAARENAAKTAPARPLHGFARRPPVVEFNKDQRSASTASAASARSSFGYLRRYPSVASFRHCTVDASLWKINADHPLRKRRAKSTRPDGNNEISPKGLTRTLKLIETPRAKPAALQLQLRSHRNFFPSLKKLMLRGSPVGNGPPATVIPRMLRDPRRPFLSGRAQCCSRRRPRCPCGVAALRPASWRRAIRVAVLTRDEWNLCNVRTSDPHPRQETVMGGGSKSHPPSKTRKGQKQQKDMSQRAWRCVENILPRPDLPKPPRFNAVMRLRDRKRVCELIQCLRCNSMPQCRNSTSENLSSVKLRAEAQNISACIASI